MEPGGSRPAHGATPKCGGTNRQDKPCGNTAGYKTDHPGFGNCHFHGGSSPNGRTAAFTEQAERLLYRHDAEPCRNPLEALQRLAGRALALEQTIGEMVNKLTSIRYESGGESSTEQLRAEVAVLERAMDRCGKLLVDIAKLNIEERLARVTEEQTRMAADALAAALAEMGLSREQQRDARERVARHLRAA